MPSHPKPTTAPLPLPPPQPPSKPVVKATKMAQPLKIRKPSKVSRRLSNSSLNNKSMPTLSKAQREKHFPNLSRKIIIPNIGGDNTDSEEENETNAAAQMSTQNGSTSSMFGGLNLEAFLKEARNTAAPPSSQSNSNKPAQPRKKLMMTPKLKAQAQKLTLADKKKLISSKISHLSRSTQIEYQRLKEILAKKEREKVLSKRDGAQKKPGDPSVVKNHPKPTASPNIGSPKCASPLPTEMINTGYESLQVLNRENTTQPDSCEKLDSKQPPPAEESQSSSPEESSAVPQDAIEKSSAVPLDSIGQKPPVAESTEMAAGKGRQRQESEDDEAALRLNLIESMKKSVAEKKSGLKELEEDEKANKESKRPRSKERALPSRKVVHSRHSPSRGGNKIAKDGSKSNGGLDQVTVKISSDNKARNVEVRSGSGGSVDKRSREDGEKKIKIKKDAITGAGDKTEVIEKDADECEKKVGSYSEIEQGVVEGRKALSESLFKLSAFMSQLQKKSLDLESGRRYAEELRKQLKETEDLVRVREGNVEKLKESIKHQHQQIVTERSALVKLEEMCKSKGVAVPEEGAENIQKKLAQIKNTAMKVKTSQSTDAAKEKGNRNDITVKEKTLNNPMGPPPEAVKTVAKAASELTREELSKPKNTAQHEPMKKSSCVPDVAGSTNSGVGLVAEQVGSCRESLGGDYASPLAHLRSTVSTLDPNRTLCRFQLSGKCLDPACPDQHTAE